MVGTREGEGFLFSRAQQFSRPAPRKLRGPPTASLDSARGPRWLAETLGDFPSAGCCSTSTTSAAGGTKAGGRQPGRGIRDSVTDLTAQSGDILPKRDSLYSYLHSSSFLGLYRLWFPKLAF